jgi:co-chaperonin GroES (HSP10)
MLKAVGTTMVIERVAGTKSTQSGIILQREQERPNARVLSVGPQVKEDISVGDIIVVDWSKCGHFEHENRTYHLVDESTVLAVLE